MDAGVGMGMEVDATNDVSVPEEVGSEEEYVGSKDDVLAEADDVEV